MLAKQLSLLLLALLVMAAAGCNATNRKNVLGKFMWGIVESAAFEKDQDQNRDFREPGLTRQESKERFENYQRYQAEQNSFLSDHQKEEAAEQRQRDAALLDGWLKQKQTSEFFKRDRSKDLF